MKLGLLLGFKGILPEPVPRISSCTEKSLPSPQGRMCRTGAASTSTGSLSTKYGQGVWSHEGKCRNPVLAATELSPHLGQAGEEKKGIWGPEGESRVEEVALLDRQS